MLRFTTNARGVKVIALWLLVPGAVLTPFLFWQSFWLGLLFCAVWLFLCLVCLPLRLSSFRGSVSLGEVRVSRGILFKTHRRIPTRFVTGVNRVRTPLLRAANCSFLIVYTSGTLLLLPAIGDDVADRLVHVLQGGAP